METLRVRPEAYMDIPSGCLCWVYKPSKFYIHANGRMEAWSSWKGDRSAALRSIENLKSVVVENLDRPRDLTEVQRLSGVYFLNLKNNPHAPKRSEINALFDAIYAIRRDRFNQDWGAYSEDEGITPIGSPRAPQKTQI